MPKPRPLRVRVEKVKPESKRLREAHPIVRLRKVRVGYKTSKYPVPKLTTEQRRIMAYEYRLQRYSEYDIAKALGVSQPMISKYISQTAEANSARLAELGPKVRQYEIDFNDRMIIAWLPKARSPTSKLATKAAVIVLKYLERNDRLQGLVVNRSEISGPGGAPIRVNAASIDISKLSVAQLEALEEIMRIAGPPDAAVSAALPGPEWQAAEVIDGEVEEIIEEEEEDAGA
jgi:hypothetical protein